jgi:phospholipid/cholesterol/gamma-HCH transport system permease protein
LERGGARGANLKLDNICTVNLADRLYDRTWRRVRHLGAVALLAEATVQGMFSRPLSVREVVRQLDALGVRSASLAAVISLFTGMVMALQTSYALAAFGAKLYLGEAVALSIVRELGPVLTALMVGGRVGAGITAEIGSMTVSEQVDALRSLGADPIRKLVVPRTWALLIGLPLLVMLADAMGIIGGLIIATWELGLAPGFYASHVLRTLEYGDVFSGLTKTVFFAFAIALISCHNGLHASGGADGVGRATTDTVVAIAISVLAIDFFLTKLFLAL